MKSRAAKARTRMHSESGLSYQSRFPLKTDKHIITLYRNEEGLKNETKLKYLKSYLYFLDEILLT